MFFSWIYSNLQNLFLCRIHRSSNDPFFKLQGAKGQTKSKWFFQADVSSKKQTNEFDFTTMIPQVDLFSFVFWKKLKPPKRHFEINWPLAMIYINLVSINNLKYFSCFLIVHPKIHILYKASPAAFNGMSNDILRSELQLVDSAIHTFCVRPSGELWRFRL